MEGVRCSYKPIRNLKGGYQDFSRQNQLMRVEPRPGEGTGQLGIRMIESLLVTVVREKAALDTNDRRRRVR